MAQQTQSVNTAPLHRLTEAMRIFQAATKTKEHREGNSQFQAQLLRCFLYIATRHPNEVSLGEAEKYLGFTQTMGSRNFGYLAGGNAKQPEGYKLIEVYSDPFYSKRKLARLTSKGVTVANDLAKAMQ